MGVSVSSSSMKLISMKTKGRPPRQAPFKVIKLTEKQAQQKSLLVKQLKKKFLEEKELLAENIIEE